MLYESGVPVCPTCASLQQAKFEKKDDAALMHAALVRDLTNATLQTESAMIEFNAVTSDIPSFVPQPEGTRRIHNVSRALSAARDEMMRAHKRLNDFVEHGIVPEDLKQR
jgi:hypothetical protein